MDSHHRAACVRIGVAHVLVPQWLRAAVRAHGFRHAPPRERDSRCHMRSRRRGGWIRNRSTAPFRGRRVDDEQPADRVVHSRRRVVVVGTTIRSALSESHRTRARKVPRVSTGQLRVGSRLDALGRAGEFPDQLLPERHLPSLRLTTSRHASIPTFRRWPICDPETCHV